MGKSRGRAGISTYSMLHTALGRNRRQVTEYQTLAVKPRVQHRCCTRSLAEVIPISNAQRVFRFVPCVPALATATGGDCAIRQEKAEAWGAGSGWRVLPDVAAGGRPIRRRRPPTQCRAQLLARALWATWLFPAGRGHPDPAIGPPSETAGDAGSVEAPCQRRPPGHRQRVLPSLQLPRADPRASTAGLDAEQGSSDGRTCTAEPSFPAPGRARASHADIFGQIAP
jgi:hypothetical protein